MNLSDTAPTSPLPDSPRRTAERRGRRRRRGQLNIPRDAEGRAAVLASLSHRAYPTYELFVYAALCGAIVGLGLLLDSQALLVFAALVAPLLLPWVGLLLATVTGSMRFFFDILVALLVSAALVFVTGVLSGFAARALMPRNFSEAFIHSRLWWPDLVVLALGAVILTVSFVRSEAKPFLPSVLVAYELFIPLAAGGFGLGGGLGDIWPYGLLVFVVHFCWACMFGLLTLAALRIMPASAESFVFSAAVAFVLLAVLVVLMNGGNWSSPFGLQAANSNPSLGSSFNLPPPSDSSSPTTPVDTATPAVTPFDTPQPATFVATQPPSDTPTITLTIEPTPIYAMVHTPKGTILRETPGGKGIIALDNSTWVQLLPETQDVGGNTWAHVIASPNGVALKGWVVQLYLLTSTPNPALEPATTSGPGGTATP
jgi:hypothetical protein